MKNHFHKIENVPKFFNYRYGKPLLVFLKFRGFQKNQSFPFTVFNFI